MNTRENLKNIIREELVKYFKNKSTNIKELAEPEMLDRADEQTSLLSIIASSLDGVISKLEGIDMSIDDLTAAMTGERPISLQLRQKAGRARLRPGAPMGHVAEKKKN